MSVANENQNKPDTGQFGQGRGVVNPLNFRSVEIFQPYPNEFPEQLLMDAGADDALILHWEQADIVRIAKLQESILGMYAMSRQSTSQFVLYGTVVEAPKRKRGLGRWLTGHALGVAESKGGRCVLLTGQGSRRMFERMGFVTDQLGLRFDLIQE